MSKPGRSLCKDVSLLLDLAVLAPQFDQLLTFGCVQRQPASLHARADFTMLADPGIDAVGMAAKLLGKLSGLAPSVDEFHHLLAKLRRVRRL